MEKNPYNPITEPASHKWWEETKKVTLTIAHQKKLTHEEQVEANEKLLVKIKEDVISLGERLIAKNQELSELQEKYNTLLSDHIAQDHKLVESYKVRKKLEDAFRELVSEDCVSFGNKSVEYWLEKAGLKEQ